MEVKITKFPLRMDVGFLPIVVYYFPLNYEFKAYLTTIAFMINKIKYCSTLLHTPLQNFLDWAYAYDYIKR